MSAAYIQKLRAENEECLDRISVLEAIIRPDHQIPADWHLGPMEQRILSALLLRDRMTGEALSTLLNEKRTGEPFDVELVWSHVSKMRRKLAEAGTGVVVVHERHFGYSIKDRARWRKQLLREAA